MADAEFDTCNNVEEAEVVENTESTEAPGGRKPSTRKLHRFDSLNMEAGNVSSATSHGANASWAITMHLAFQSIGVVYGDIGTSPLYVYASTFTRGIKHEDDILGVLSLILYTLLLIPLTKYALIVLWANDNGNGGAFALYSLISRYAKVSLLPNQQVEDAMLSNYTLQTPSTKMKRAQWIKGKLEGSKAAKVALIFLTILGTSMIMGDGVLTPCISVLSAVSGIQQKATSLTEGEIAIISIIILIMLFSVQRFGIDKVGYVFAPVILLWFSLIGGIGLYNLFKHDVTVLRAFNPMYIIDYFKRNGKEGWISLGGVVLCITGAEAMFADLGHFNVRAIQISFVGALLPAVSLAYIGQAAYLTKYPENVADTFYKSLPGPLFWPTFVVAVAAAIIASQAVIACVFSIIAQAQTLGCFPRVKVVHTSAKYEGQVYIPELNFALMIACILVTGSFRTTEHIGNAYGIAVLCDMTITTCLVTLIMLMIWKKSIWQILPFFVIFGGAELTYLSSVLSKFVQGGFLPLVFSFFLMQIMAIWHYVHVKRYKFEVENKISNTYIKDLALRQDIKRISGVGFLYSELVEGIPPIFAHFIEKVPSIHSVLVFVSVKRLPVTKVEINERFLFRQVEPREYRIYRCVVRYGYKDAIEEAREFESLVIEQLKNFIHNEYTITESSESLQSVIEDEQQFVQKEMEKGIVYLLGETEVVAGKNSSIIKRIVVDYVYNFMRRNFRQGGEAMKIPRSKLLKVGMTYEI
ncbi:potassium transporter 5-like [Asparagus officinalis]|uniref:potassium transporter 5-like n=1 Tax=Asparagus officinalis TaxID=4686 RepID=UPI00098E05E4|nr:potassium transporter 5-like [Asparagus officinalis]